MFGLGLLNVLRREVNECGWGTLTVKLFGMAEGTEGMRLKKAEGSSPTSSSGTWSSCGCCIDWRRGCGLNWKVRGNDQSMAPMLVIVEDEYC